MKNAYLIFSALLGMSILGLPGITQAASTAAEQSFQLQRAGILQIESGFFSRGNMAVQVNSDGSYNFLIPFSYSGSPASIKAFGLGTDKISHDATLNILTLDERGKHVDEVEGEGGSYYGDDAAAIAQLEKVETQTFAQQLTAIGFQATGSQQTVFTRQLDQTQLFVVLNGGAVTGIFTNADKEISDRLQGTSIVGYTEEKEEYGDTMDSGLKVKNNFMKFNVISQYGGRVDAVEFLKDLSEIDLKDLGLKIPAPTKDPSGFLIGGFNPTNFIIGLSSLNGISITEIGARGNKVSGCSHGDPLVATGENVAQLMAQDNDKVQKLGTTHQALAKPLLYAQALVNGQYGDTFTFRGIKYQVSNLAMPMCGSLDSPFNDNYHTPIMFPRITNLATNKFLDYSYLHPYLINQYGFYGSHANRSYVSPEAIVDVFGK